jgi:ligand-binding SRPBCC domain-containing protein
MPVIKLEFIINAPIERLFDLARCIDLHEKTMSKHKEKAIAGITEGLINPGETVTWKATHFGVRQTLTSKITEFNYPKHFRDEMVNGIFEGFTHDHYFEEIEDSTIMKDVFDYTSPLWILGNIADVLFLEKYMKNMLEERNNLIKSIAESEEWRTFLS